MTGDPAHTAAERANVAVVLRFVDTVLNAGRPDLAGETWHDDLVWEGGSLGTHHGIDAFRRMLGAGGRGRWVGLHLTVHDVFARDDEVVVRFTNSGRRTGRLAGVLPFTSRVASWNGVGVYTVRDGRIARGWFVEDVVAMLRGLGPRGALDLITASR